MNIDSIKDGYVIDHIRAGRAMDIYKQLKLSQLDCQVAIITNAKSSKTGTKDIIKIDKNIKIDLDKLGFIDHNVTVDIIKDDKVIEKKKLSLPDSIINLAQCSNPRCITSAEKDLDQIFILTDREKGVYRCKYCESRLIKK